MQRGGDRLLQLLCRRRAFGEQCHQVLFIGTAHSEPQAAKLGMTNETLRKWVRQAEIDGGARPGVSSAEAERVKELERENRELRRANEILKAASVFFARELDPQPPKR